MIFFSPEDSVQHHDNDCFQQSSMEQLTSTDAFYNKLMQVKLPPPPQLPPPNQQGSTCFHHLSAQQKQEQEMLAKALPTVASSSRTSRRASGAQSPSFKAQATTASKQEATLEPTEESNQALLNRLRVRLDDAFPSAVSAVMPSSSPLEEPWSPLQAATLEPTKDPTLAPVNQLRVQPDDAFPSAVMAAMPSANPVKAPRWPSKESQASDLQTERILGKESSTFIDEPRGSSPKFGMAERSSLAHVYISSSHSAIATAESADEAADAAVALLLM